MTDNNEQLYKSTLKKAWIIYSIAAVVLATVLVLFVAQDNEERMFFGIMTIAAAYVLRPGEKLMDRKIKQYTGISNPANEE